ncbi:uncharacterized protein A1O9_06936 [Exophiala aquamarina CBS 119918]|uniref:Major facilitator superfamily (MFS) profile domain-containing protein n=1 Tax=Exophiala aquamarina CBS 119918 TaxID=1182545 RepID=A0A072PA71_9EURO|nr:uncharacterized protein A1O9_06936 [Exophiala aquamarina CBS 119918]KEF56746.1 hypothetical protein A1O9_06936 [Exophiala aquamarina CBS 119918]
MFCGGVMLFGLAFFLPSIVQGLGYGPIRTQLMTVPSFAVAFVVTLILAYFADRYRKRGAAAILTMLIARVGVIMFYKGRNIAVRYTALFFIVTGAYANGPCLLARVPNNTATHVRRATAIATAFMFTNSVGHCEHFDLPDQRCTILSVRFSIHTLLGRHFACGDYDRDGDTKLLQQAEAGSRISGQVVARRAAFEPGRSEGSAGRRTSEL